MEEAREPAECVAPRRARAWGFALAFLALDSALFGWWWRSRPVEPPTVAGVVIDPEGRPVEGVVNWPLSFEHGDEGFQTDEQGRFEVFLPDRRSVLVAYGSGHSESAPLVLDGASRRSVEDVVLRLRRPARVVGRLKDEAGLPMAGVIVYCRSGTTANLCLMNESTTTDDDAASSSRSAPRARPACSPAGSAVPSSCPKARGPKRS
jgi:hypothetical protein